MLFDPWLICLQIATLQCFFYITIGIVLGIFKIVDAAIPFKLALIFAPSSLSLSAECGMIVSIAFILSGLFGYVILINANMLLVYTFRGYLLSIIVERIKKCLDFTFTLFFIHIIISICYEVFDVEAVEVYTFNYYW